MIQLINSLSKELVSEISPRSSNLWRSIKVPLVAMTWTAGLLVATTLTLGKLLAEIIISNEVEHMPFIALLSAVGAGITCTAIVFVLSIAMRYYDNIDAIPMFQSFILLSMLAAGWIVLDEI